MQEWVLAQIDTYRSRPVRRITVLRARVHTEELGTVYMLLRKARTDTFA